MIRKQYWFYKSDLVEAKRCAQESGVSVSQFVRDALTARVEGSTAITEIRVLKEEVTQLIHEFRVETIRARADMLEDTDRSVQIFRQEVGESLRRNEELMKAFVRALGKQLEATLAVEPAQEIARPNPERPKPDPMEWTPTPPTKRK